MTDDQPAPPAPKRPRRRATPGAAEPSAAAERAPVNGSPGTESLAAEPASEATAAEPSSGAAAATDRPLVEVLRIERGGIGEATAGAVDVHMGGIGALSAEDVFVQWGGVGAARADKLGVEFGGVGAALAGEVRVTQGWARSVVAREATLEQAFARTVIAQHVDVRRPSVVLVLVAQRVEGDVRALVDWGGALAFGAAFGLVAGIVRAASDQSRKPARVPWGRRRR